MTTIRLAVITILVALASPGIGIADDPPPEPTPTAAAADAPAPRAPEPPPQPDHRAEGPVLAIGEAGTRVRFGASAHTDARDRGHDPPDCPPVSRAMQSIQSNHVAEVI